MNKFKLPEPPIFNINPPPMPPMESSKSFLFSNFDYLFEITNNKCLGLVNKNYKNIDINDNKINYVLVVLSVFLIIFLIILFILILNCFIKYNFIKLFKKFMSKLIKFGKNDKVSIDSKTFIISSNSIVSNIYEKIDITTSMAKQKQEEIDNYNHLIRINGTVETIPNLYYSILTMQQQVNDIKSNTYYSINI